METKKFTFEGTQNQLMHANDTIMVVAKWIDWLNGIYENGSDYEFIRALTDPVALHDVMEAVDNYTSSNDYQDPREELGNFFWESDYSNIQLNFLSGRLDRATRPIGDPNNQER